MTTQTATLTEFLLARIAEEVEDAQAVLDAAEPVFVTTDGIEWSGEWPGRIHGGRRGSDVMHITAARVLAECEAKRRIVEAYARVEAGNYGEFVQGDVSSDPEMISGVDSALEFACYSLSLPYADHPDYRPEWKP